ncbi:MAG: hypothetical protein PHP61_06290 [Candidatus Izemoplasmatales bacterium]|nr:hypothetical protein [Candidatus Izemoplasmatales bacterium]MDY0374026.1 hypothetical protein [Candidatus Izemoplasmatales bacterium]
MFKKFMAAIAVAIVLGGSAFAYAWWDNLDQTQEETLTIGQGVTLEVAASAVAPEGKFLVPTGAVLKANDVTEIVLTYNVALDQAVINPLTLSVVASDVLINADATYADLVNINIVKAETTVNNADVLVTVTVTLTEPATELAYNAVHNQPITFTLSFSAAQ